MYTRRRFKLIPAIMWTSEVLLPTILWSSAVTATHILGGFEWLRLPALPVTVLGTAVAFYLGFKGNASYERLWEARKIWGGIVNTSRTWGTFVTTLVTDQHCTTPPQTPLAEVHRELVYRHVAWLAALRVQLLRPKSWEHREPWNDNFRDAFGTLDTSDARLQAGIAPLLQTAEVDMLMARKNRATQLVQRQGERLRDLLFEGRIEDFRHMQLLAIIEELYTLQGKCERIKNFPLPRQYSTANHWFVVIFITMLPFALVGSFHGTDLPEAYAWATIPASVVVSWVFYMWDRVLDYSENPFEGLINDVPMGALSRTIEIDLREMLGEATLPPPLPLINGEVMM